MRDGSLTFNELIDRNFAYCHLYEAVLMKNVSSKVVARRLRFAGFLVVCVLSLYEVAASQPRGELLYSTNCIACHSTQVHWRDKKLATDWGSLREQVRRWQDVASLGWRDDDIIEVTRYLNDLYYNYPASNAVGSRPPESSTASSSH